MKRFIALGIALAAVWPIATSAELDMSALNEQVQQHEQRITNLESRADNTDVVVAQHGQKLQEITTVTSAPPPESPAPVAPSPTPDSVASMPDVEPEPTPAPLDPNSNACQARPDQCR